MFDSSENHKKGFCISLNSESNALEVQRIDEPETWEVENQYDFKIPQLENDDEAKALAVKEGYLFTDEKNPYKVTGKLRKDFFNSLKTDSYKL